MSDLTNNEDFDGNEDFGYTDRVKTLRVKEGLTQEDFASKIGVSTVLISNIETKNKKLTLDKAMKIAKKFNVSLDWLYELSEDTNDKASNILVALKEIFDINLLERNIVIEQETAEFLEELQEAYKTKMSSKTMTKETFNSWIEAIKKSYNEKEKSGKKTQYYLQTIDEHFREKTPKTVVPNILP